MISVEIFLTVHSEGTETSSCFEVELLSILCQACIVLIGLWGPFFDARYQGSQPHALRGYDEERERELFVCVFEVEGVDSLSFPSLLLISK